MILWYHELPLSNENEWTVDTYNTWMNLERILLSVKANPKGLHSARFCHILIILLKRQNHRNGEQISGQGGAKWKGNRCGNKRTTGRILIVMEIFYLLTSSYDMLWHCTTVSKKVHRISVYHFLQLHANLFSQIMCAQSLSRVRLFETPWTAACQSPLSMGILQARIQEWVAVLSSKGSSQSRDRTQISHIAGRFFIIWATGEALLKLKSLIKHFY